MREHKGEHLQTLLRGALAHPPEARHRWIDETCSGDLALRERLVALIRVVEEETELGQGFPGPGRASDPIVGEPRAKEGGPESQLTPGQQLGRYEILELLGAGGMGRVYRALDPSLGREVAIKALADAFRGDTASLRRFEREARVLATLSHPNIASIYGFERLGGSPYLVLERVDGETLSQRLAAGPMSLREAVAVALQIIEGLQEAHAKGVTHRDLKPSNVMLAPSGRAKLVDFGLAKTATKPAEADPSLEPITEAGAVVGTARYMSPEQVHGDEIDTRTDVWAFGCLLYEMLCGRAAFPGRSVQAVLAAVLRDDPDWSALPDDVPPAIRRLLRRCLRRDPRLRLQHIGDARLDLLDEDEEPAASTVRAESRWVRWALAGVAAALAGTLVALVLQRTAPARSGRLPARLSLELPRAIELGNDYSAPFAMSPAGSTLVVEAQEGGIRRLYVRGLDDVPLRPILGTEGARQPFFSAGGESVAFFADRRLMRVPVAGGAALQLADIGGNPRGATWAAGSIVVAPSQTSGLVRVSDRGGPLVTVTTVDRTRGEYSHRWPDAVPGGPWVLFTVGLEDASFDEARIEAVSLETGERRVVLAGRGSRATCRLAGCSSRVAADSMSWRSTPARSRSTASPTSWSTASATTRGTAAATWRSPRPAPSSTAPASRISSDYYLAWVDREGRLVRAMDTPRPYRDPRLAPDGMRIATVVGTSTESDLWLVDANATFSRLSFGLSPHRPAWSPDGTRISVGAQRSGVWHVLSLASDGSGSPITLFESPNRVYPNAWSPDGRYLLFQESRPETGWDLRVLETDSSGRPVGAPRTLAATPFHESGAALSPDGRWVAYESDEVDGVVQVYVRSFPDGAHKIRVSTGGARLPVWGRGGALYYRHTGQDRLHVVHTRTEGGQLNVTAVEPVWTTEPAATARLVISVAGARFDVHPSATRFLALEAAGAASTPVFSRPVVVLDHRFGRAGL